MAQAILTIIMVQAKLTTHVASYIVQIFDKGKCVKINNFFPTKYFYQL